MWIGVILNGTLAEFVEPKPGGPFAIGKPVAPMCKRVQSWLANGKDVRVVGGFAPEENFEVLRWLEVTFGAGNGIAVTDLIDSGMTEFWGHIAVTVERNTGKRMNEKVGFGVGGLT